MFAWWRRTTVRPTRVLQQRGGGLFLAMLGTPFAHETQSVHYPTLSGPDGTRRSRHRRIQASMKPYPNIRLIALALVSAARLAAQAAAAPDTATLAKYDTNRNGKLDPEELAAMQAAEKEAVKLSPFEVRT